MSVAEGDDGAVARQEGNGPVQLVASGDDNSDDEDDDDNPDDGGDDKPDDGPDDDDDRPDDDDRHDDDDGPDRDDDDKKDDDKKDDDRDDRKDDDRNADKADKDNVEDNKPSELPQPVPNWYLILCVHAAELTNDSFPAEGCIHRGTLHTIEKGSVEIHQALCLLCACQPSGLLHCFKTC